jgi:DNA-directed RNA polymerase specialized sigma24 family protein
VALHPVTVELNDLDLTDRHPLEDVIDLSTALGQLSENDVEMLRLLHWEGLGRSDAAEVLGCSVNTLNVRYHRAVAKLASTLHRFSNVSSSEIEVPKEHK